MKKLVIFLLSLMISLTIHAQIDGIVKEKESGEVIVGATIYILELERGTISDVQGHFTFDELPLTELTIQVSFIGYQTEYFKWSPESTKDQFTIELIQATIRHEEIVITAGFSETQHRNAINVEFIDSKEMHNSSAPSSNQLLSDIPGVDLASGSSAVSQPVIRGLSGTNILILNNGIRLENYQFSRQHPFIIDEYGTERIEVIKGPASLLYGSDAVGGVINFIKELPASSEQMEADVTSRYFSNTNGFNTTMGVKQSSKQFQWGFRGISKAHEDYTDGNNVTVPNSRYTSKGIKSFIGYNFLNGSTKLYYDYTKDDIGMTLGNLDEFNLGNSKKPEEFFQDLNNHFLISKTNLLLGDLKLSANIGYQNNQRKFIEAPSVDDNGIAINSRLNTLNYEVKAQRHLNDNFKLIVGMQGMLRNNTNYEAEGKILPDADLFDLSGFAFMQFSAEEKITIQGGLRYDYRSLDVPYQERGSHSHGEESIDPSALTEEEEHIELYRKFNNMSGSLGATFQLTKPTLFRVNIASAFRAPNLAELTQAGVHAGRHEEGNPNLEAQRSFEIDLGLHSHYDLLTFDFSAFYNNINNYIYLTPTGEIEDGAFVYEYQQDLAELMGAEAGIHLHPKGAKWLHIKGTGAFVDAKQKDGSRLPFIPPLRGNLELRTETPELGKLDNSFILVDIKMSSDQNHPSEFETRTPGYYLLNFEAGTAYHLGSVNINLSMAINNLLDRHYVDHLNLFKPLGYYNMGRNLSIGLSARF